VESNCGVLLPGRNAGCFHIGGCDLGGEFLGLNAGCCDILWT
jgi:hypothetical protein